MAADDPVGPEIREELEAAFRKMMRALFEEKGAFLRVEILEEPAAQGFIGSHAAALDSSFRQVEMSDIMRKRLRESDYVFSGMKAFHELNEAFPSLLDENGDRKPFERFLKDVQNINATYNSNYLRTEYNFVHASAAMAARWERFAEDADRYLLQYRTATDGKVRPEHAALHGVTLPFSDPFWDEFFPPNGWNCRCSVVQVPKSKYAATPHDEAMERAEAAMAKDSGRMFRFNPGKEGKAAPDYNPYTVSRCRDCDIAKGEIKLARVVPPDNELCAACRIVRELTVADAKRTRKLAKGLQGTTIANPDFPYPVRITKKSLREWTNQPFKHYREKNRMLLDIPEVFGKARYLGTADNHKGVPHVVRSHIFETEVAGDKALIIVREYEWGDFVLHSASDGKELYNHIKRNSD